MPAPAPTKGVSPPPPFTPDRAGLEGLLGRELTAAKVATLTSHAEHHADQVLKPVLGRYLPE